MYTNMPIPKKVSEKVEFKEGTTVQVVLNTEPSMAKEFVRDTQWGVKKSYGYFCEDNKVFFATETLHSKLLQYHKGDTLSITFAEKRWSVSPAGGRASGGLEPVLQNQLDTTESKILLRKIAMDIDQIKNKLYGNETKETSEKEYPGDEDIAF